jgi:zinc protease
MSALFQLLYCIFTRPRVDQNGLSLVLDNYRTKLQSESDVPEAFFFRELTRLIYSDHPLLAPLELGDLDHVNGKAALAFLTLAMNPADYTLVFAGSLGDRDEFKKLVEMYLASIPNGGLPRWNAWLDPEVKRPEKTEKIVYKGKEEKCIVSMCWYVPKIWTEEDNGAVLVLNEYLEIVLTDEIREKLGGVYSISSYVSLSPAPTGELSLEIFFICDPARAAELRKAVKNQLTALCSAADAETVTRAKEALVRNFEQSMENNGFVARNLANFLVITNTPLSHLPERPSLYRAVTEESIRKLMAELLKGGPIELVLMPESADK